MRFVEAPVRAFLRDRLGISVGEFFDEVEDELPVELDGLGKVGRRAAIARWACSPAPSSTPAMNAEIARGTLPPGVLARPVLEDIGTVVAQLAAASKGLVGDERARLARRRVSRYPTGATLAGTVTGVCADTSVQSSYSAVRPQDRLRAWVKLLALTAARPERPFDRS